MMRKWKVVFISRVMAYLSQQVRLVVPFVFLVAGLTIGAVLAAHPDLIDPASFSELVSGFIASRVAAGYWSVVLHSFLTAGAFLLAAYAGGLFAYGTAVCLALPFVRGLGVGLACGMLYGSHGFRGVAFCALLLVPAAFFNCLVLLAACRDSIGFSGKIFLWIRSGVTADAVQSDCKRLHLHYMVYTVLTALIALADGLLSRMFMGAFSF